MSGNPLSRNRKAAAFAVRVAIVVSAVAGADVASAYVGKSFLQVPGMTGDWQGEQYRSWIRIDGHYWKSTPFSIFGRRRRTDWAFYSGPTAPRQGESSIVTSIRKTSPILPQLMERCLKKTRIAELKYAEASNLARQSLELGERPADIPEYFEYRLTDVVISDCPVVADAPEQALVFTFKNIEWLNYHREGDGVELVLEPAVLPPAQTSGATKTFVVSWIAPANDVSGEQCAVMTEKPTEADYYALMSKEEAARERARLAPRGGPTFPDGQMCFRGPHQLNACLLPGIVKDPVQPTPNVTVSRGLDLDGDDGTGDPPPGTCKHKNFVSEDGRRGIDNQLFAVEGCMRGYMGHKGQVYQFGNEQMRNGRLAFMVQVSGIDDEQNDDSIDVTLLYSLDPMSKDAGGKQVLPDYTFRATDKPEYTHHFARLRGRIVKGVITTERVSQLRFHLINSIPVVLHQAGMRLEILPDGSIKGVAAGYQEWRKIVNANGHSLQESLFGSQVAAMYNAHQRAADGLKNPVTGECDGISYTYDIEGVPAFLPPGQQLQDLTTQVQEKPRRRRE